MAGLAAALSAAQQGAQVTLLEKGPQHGGSARLSSGFIWTHRDLDALYAAIPHGNPLLQALVVEQLEAGVAWLREQQVQTGERRQILDYGQGWQVDAEAMIARLADALAARGVEVRTAAALEAIDAGEDGGVRAVRVAAGSSTGLVAADAVVLATGGFQGNAELVTRHCVPTASSVYLRANPWSTGDGFIAASAIGAAASAGMEAFYGHAMLGPPARLAAGDFAAITQYQGCFSVALNLEGRRFADETAGTGEEVLNQALARQPEGRGVYVCDAAGARRACLPPGLLETRVVLERARARGALLEAASLAELARGLERFDVNPQAALASLEEFNAAMTGRIPSLTPRRGRFRAPLGEPPYYAVPVKASITFTTGGLAVDERLRVLRRAASSSPLAHFVRSADELRAVPIRGLYAAGGDAGNMSNGGYMGGLACALVTGRAAGLQAAGA